MPYPRIVEGGSSQYEILRQATDSEDVDNAYATKIAVLHHIAPIVSPAFKNPLSCPARNRPGPYSLTFEHERYLCSTLAFLSSTANNPNRIPALCLQEIPDEGRLKVLVAVNSAKYSDGDRTLAKIEQGLSRLCLLASQVLQCMSIRHRYSRASHIMSRLWARCADKAEATSSNEDIFFAEIVTMCSERIKERLSLNDKTQKRTARQHLETAIAAASGSWPYRNGMRSVINSIKSWENHRTETKLKQVVEDAYVLCQQVGNLESIVNSIPNIHMDPGSRRSVLNTITKVARYRKAARYLYQTATIHPVVRNMTVVPVRLPPEAFADAPDTSSTSEPLSLFTTIDRNLSNQQRKRGGVGRLWGVLGTNEMTACRAILKQRNKTLTEGKIHAEIQLIYHCEARGEGPAPRVICSSKDACFLCNAFMEAHGKFHNPRCHGRLYPGWRLPHFPRYIAAERQFNRALEKHIQNCIREILTRGKKLSYPTDRAESTILTPLASIITLGGTGYGDSDTPEDTNGTDLPATHTYPGPNTSAVHSENRSDTDQDVEPLREVAASHGSECGPGVKPEANLACKAEWELEHQPAPALASEPTPDSTSNLAFKTTATRKDSVLIQLARGRATEIPVKKGETSALYEAWPIRLQIEGPDDAESVTTRQAKSDSTVQCSLEWLRPEDAAVVRRTAKIIDLEHLRDEISIGRDEEGKFYVSRWGTLLQICISR